MSSLQFYEDSDPLPLQNAIRRQDDFYPDYVEYAEEERRRLQNILDTESPWGWEESPPGYTAPRDITPRGFRFPDEQMDSDQEEALPGYRTPRGQWFPRDRTLSNQLQNEDRELRRRFSFESHGERTDTYCEGADEYDPPPSQFYGTLEQEGAGESTDMSFMNLHDRGDATLTYHCDGQLRSVTNINLEVVAINSPLIAAAFEVTENGPKLFLEELTSVTAKPFVRYLYTGDYLLADAYDVPTSLLAHCQVFRLASIYDISELKSLANVNVMRQCEFACSSALPPIDLCAAISFAFSHMDTLSNQADTIVNYCVTCFTSHRLVENEQFRKLMYNHRQFNQALCKNCIDRGFENETAMNIIQTPFKAYAPETYLSREDIDGKPYADPVYHFHSLEEPRPKRQTPVVANDRPSLAIRIKALCPHPSMEMVTDESGSEEEDYRVVHNLRDAQPGSVSGTESAHLSDFASEASLDIHSASEDEGWGIVQDRADPPPITTRSTNIHQRMQAFQASRGLSGISQSSLPIRGRASRNASSSSDSEGWSVV